MTRPTNEPEKSLQRGTAMNDAEFCFYLEEVAKAAQLTPASLQRKLKRFENGQRKHKDTAQDWNRPGFDLLRQAREEGDDAWQYLTKYVFNTGDKSGDFKVIFLLLAAVEELIGRRIAARSAETECDEKEGASSASPAGGQPVRSGMECYGVMADEESALYGGENEH